jgi:hypothetical protein
MKAKFLNRVFFSTVILTALALLAPVRWSTRTACAAGFEQPSSPEERRALFRRGAQLWPVYCNTCHNARPGSEFSATEWNMILMHMRTQANLPAEDARAVLEYLKSSK